MASNHHISGYSVVKLFVLVLLASLEKTCRAFMIDNGAKMRRSEFMLSMITRKGMNSAKSPNIKSPDLKIADSSPIAVAVGETRNDVGPEKRWERRTVAMGEIDAFTSNQGYHKTREQKEQSEWKRSDVRSTGNDINRDNRDYNQPRDRGNGGRTWERRGNSAAAARGGGGGRGGERTNEFGSALGEKWQSGRMFNDRRGGRGGRGGRRRNDPWWMREEEGNNPRILEPYQPWWLRNGGIHIDQSSLKVADLREELLLRGTCIDPKNPYDVNADFEKLKTNGENAEMDQSLKTIVGSMKKNESQNEAYFPSGDSTKITASAFTTPVYTDRPIYQYAEGSSSPSLLKYKAENHKLPACYPEVYEDGSLDN